MGFGESSKSQPNNKMEEKSCYCFPEREELRKKYYVALDDKYYAEKTFPTVSEWLASKNVQSCGTVSIYADYDYQSYVCSENGVVCTLSKMHSQQNMRNVQEALNSIARKCPCK